MWQDNLFNNLLVLFIIVSLIIIIYCKVTNKTISDLIKDIKEAFTPNEQ